MESYEKNRVKWLIDKPGGLFLTRRSGTLRRAGGVAVEPKLSTPFYPTYPDLSLKSEVITLNKYLFAGLRAVSRYTPYQGFSSNCVNWGSLGLWLNGIPNIGIQPFLLHGSIALYNTGIYNILSYQLLNQYK